MIMNEWSSLLNRTVYNPIVEKWDCNFLVICLVLLQNLIKYACLFFYKYSHVKKCFNLVELKKNIELRKIVFFFFSFQKISLLVMLYSHDSLQFPWEVDKQS